MELVILSLLEAVKYVPQNRTYAIRISSEFSLDHLYDLVESDNWVRIASYVFDDVCKGCIFLKNCIKVGVNRSFIKDLGRRYD